MIVCQRWLGVFLISAVGLFATSAAELRAQSAGTVIEPAPVAQTSVDSVDPSVLNLWAPSGRPRTFVNRETREVLETIEIIDRPNRPFHFYGNTVRRRHSR